MPHTFTSSFPQQNKRHIFAIVELVQRRTLPLQRIRAPTKTHRYG
jgi:hypothetical protein